MDLSLLVRVYLTPKPGEIFYDECNILIGCVGILDRPKLADIKNRDTYKGKLVHPARWDHSIDLTGKRVAVIGNGSFSGGDWKRHYEEGYGGYHE